MTPPPLSFLLIDADSHGLEALTYGFEREGIKVTRSSELARAAQLAATGNPAGAVVALQQMTEDALRVIAELRRARPDLPILALGPGTVSAAAKLAGATDFLRGPSFIRDVVAVARLGLLARKPADARARGRNPDGDLRLSEYGGVFYLLRALQSCGRSALIVMVRGSRRAELRVYEGALVAANVAALQSLPALHHALLWEEAALSIKLQPIPKHTQMTLTSQEVLDESERFLRDFAHGVRDLGAADTLFVPVPAAKRMQLPGLATTQIAPLLKLFDGKRVLADVVSESPFRIFDTVRMIRRLRDAGALVKRDGKRATGKQSMLAEWAMVPDPRGVVGGGGGAGSDRRRTSRTLRPLGPAPARPTPAPLAVSIPSVEPAALPLAATATSSPLLATVSVIPVAPDGGAAAAVSLASAAVLPDAATPGLEALLAHNGASAPTVAPAEDAPEPIAPLAPADAAAADVMVPAAVGPGSETTAPLAALLMRQPDAPAPVAAAPSSPIQLTNRKTATVSGEISAPRRHETPPAALAVAPTIQVKLAPDGTPLSEPKAPAVAPTPAPLIPAEQMLIPPEPRLSREPLMPPEPTAPPPQKKTPIPLRVRGGKTGPRELTPVPRVRPPSGPHSTFDEIEADFFAREADLYKREAVETFEDLDRPLGNTPARKRNK
jgi:ActR/RegA family two-component response regulator